MPASTPFVRDDRGTATMETLLCLPFLVLLLVLMFDFCHVWLIRIDTDVATRFATTTYLHAAPGSDGREVVRRALVEHYGDLRILGLELDQRAESGNIDPSGGSGWNHIVGTLAGWLQGLGTRHSVGLDVEVELPIGTVVQADTVTAYYELDGRTWTYDEVPLSMNGLVDRVTGLQPSEGQGSGIVGTAVRIMARFFGYVFKGFFWLLGMYP